jgi:uncharacterized damage-inducible protein DinB
MVDKIQFEMMARYNQWMNRKIYAVCAEVPDDDRTKDMGAFFKSIHATLNHLLYGDKAWMGRFTGNPFLTDNMGVDLYSDFEELRKEREKMDQQIIEWSQTLTPEWLDSEMTYTSKVDNKSRTMPNWAAVTQLFNHQTHHRGQITTLIKQLGKDPGPTDVPWLPEFNNND